MALTVNVCLALSVMLMWNVQCCKVAAQIPSAMLVRHVSMASALHPVAVVLMRCVTLSIIVAFVNVLPVIMVIQRSLAVLHQIPVIPILVALMPYVNWTMAILFATVPRDLLVILSKIAVSIVISLEFKL